MVKYKCIKAECPICKLTGSIQLFLNKQNEVRYARTRHYSHIDKDSKKPQFTYCKIQDSQALQTLLLNKGISLSTEEVTAGQVGQGKQRLTLDPQLRGCASVQQTGQRASSSVRIEHQPPKYLENIDLNIEEYRNFLLSKFSRSYALQQLNNIMKHSDCLKNPQGLSSFSASNRGNILKAMVNLAKFLGTYEDYKAKLKQHGIHWVNNDNSFNSFLRNC